MLDVITYLIIGIFCIIIGIFNRKGNISLLHSYHRKRVKEEDIIPFGKLVGLGTIIIGCGVSLAGIIIVLNQFTGNEIFLIVGNILLVVGFIVGISISFYAMIKYNKGIF